MKQINVTDISSQFEWNGDEVIQFMLDVLTDCNYHSEVKQIRNILNETL